MLIVQFNVVFDVGFDFVVSGFIASKCTSC